MTPPEGSVVISNIPDLHLYFKGQKLVWVFQEDRVLFHLILLRDFLSVIKCNVSNVMFITTNYNIVD